MGCILNEEELAAFQNDEPTCILDIQEDLMEATFMCRPSKNNKSVYVGDILLNDGTEAIAHCPAMEMGGKMYPGVKCLVKVSLNGGRKIALSQRMRSSSAEIAQQ
jgi:DNA-binding sugar fermentation-stimulating protein